jgi:hypothetical protein
MLVAALHMSAVGTIRKSLRARVTSAYWCVADQQTSLLTDPRQFDILPLWLDIGWVTHVPP